MCTNVNVLRQIDILEPYSTFITVSIGIPTFLNALFVYRQLLSDRRFTHNLYFRIFIMLGFADMIAFIFNLLRYRLALLRPFNELHGVIRETIWASLICCIHAMMPRMQIVGQIILSLNRILAIRAPIFYVTKEQHFYIFALLVIFIVPPCCTIPEFMMGYRFVPIPNIENLTIYCSGGYLGPKFDFAIAWMTAYQFTLTAIGLLCNIFLIFSVTQMRKSKPDNVVTTMGAPAKQRDTQLEQGLIITTLLMFAGHFTYSSLQISYLYLFNLIPEFRNANRGTTITLDIISMLPIWLLLIFTKSARHCAYPCIYNEGNNSVRTTVPQTTKASNLTVSSLSTEGTISMPEEIAQLTLASAKPT